MTWFRNDHDTPDGSGPPPLTEGEARTLAAVVAGVDPLDVEAFISIAVLKCPNCGLAHNTVTTNNVDDVTMIHVLSEAIRKAYERMY
jgi:hypothetical protein